VKPFQWVDLSASEKAFFSGKCVSPFSLSHCATLSLGEQGDASVGSHMVAFLRGRTNIGAQILEGTLYRDRTETDPATGTAIETVLGDIINAQPVFVRPPFFDYTDPGYAAFKLAKAARAGTLYVGANDGYLHAFDGATGNENWAYAPKFVMPAMYQLADKNYGAAHRFFVDGSPETADVCASSCTSASAVWKTLLVGGANSGGRGFYALDITDPAKPKGLWEFCSDATLCAINDPDLGLSYGNPVIGKQQSNGKWVVVVTSGLNNVSPGTGEGFFYVLDAITGTILHKVGIGANITTDPAGLMKVGAYYPDGLLDATFTHVYGGDQLGRVWRLDVSKEREDLPAVMPSYTTVARGAPFVMPLATLKDGTTPAGRIQPITARPAGTPIKTLAKPTGYRVYYVGTGRYLGNSDLSDPGLASGFAWQQSIYAIKDKFPVGAAVGYGDIRTGATLVTQTLSSLSPTVRSISKNPVNWDTQDGFVIDLNPPTDPSPGERVVLDVRLIFGTLLVTSTVPATGGCTPGGNSFQYQLDYKTGGYVKGAIDGAAGFNMGSFLVGAAVVQTTDGTIKSLNKDYTGGNTPISINVDRDPTKLQRFSYRER
jgi:type IV pilus assembly protein PilY1